jgi:hypothetical protein
LDIYWNIRIKEEVLHTVKEERNSLHTINRKKANWSGSDVAWEFLKHVIEGNNRIDGKTRKKT